MRNSIGLRKNSKGEHTVIQFDLFLYSPPEFNIIITPNEGGDSFQKNQIPRMDKLFHLVGEHQPDDMNEI